MIELKHPINGPDNDIVIDFPTEQTGVPRARAMLARAQWAAQAFSLYDKSSVDRIVSAVARTGPRKRRSMPSGRCARLASASSSTRRKRTSPARPG